MPVVSSSSKVLVTGGSGFLGAWVIKDLLERGFSVLAVYRNESGSNYGEKTFADFGERFTTIVIPDLLLDGAFDDAVKTVSGVVHVASPVFFNTKDPQELIGPAVQATVGLLKSAKKNGPQIKRIVITSSVSAMTAFADIKKHSKLPPTLWNEGSVNRVQKLGKESTGRDQYAASKTLAERAAWEFVKKEDVSFDLVTILPSWILGPWIHESRRVPMSPEHLSTFATPLLCSLALTTEAAGGERLIASADLFSTAVTLDILNSADPPFPPGSIGKRDPSYGEPNYILDFDTSRINEVFPDFKFRPIQDSVVAQARQLEARGWLG